MDTDALYNHIWQSLNKLDCELQGTHEKGEMSYLMGQHSAYIDLLGFGWPEATMKRLRTIEEKGQFTT